jgi:hypothetical protein
MLNRFRANQTSFIFRVLQSRCGKSIKIVETVRNSSKSCTETTEKKRRYRNIDN